MAFSSVHSSPFLIFVCFITLSIFAIKMIGDTILIIFISIATALLGEG